MSVKRVHVIKQRIVGNAKHGRNDPPIAIRTYSHEDVKTPKTTEYAHAIAIPGPSRMVYQPDDPLFCGAKLWLEVMGEVEIIE